MAMRDGKSITLGSGKLYLIPFTDAMPTTAEICVDDNLLGYIKSGASLEYTEETYEEKDDLGVRVQTKRSAHSFRGTVRIGKYKAFHRTNLS